MQTTRILLADDNPAVLNSVVKILQSEFIIAGAFTDGQSILEKALWLMPDFIILDISMGKLSGIEIARSLRGINCQAKLIFLSVHDDIDFVREAFILGAAAYVIKSAVTTDLVDAIHAASRNMLFYPQILLDVRSSRETGAGFSSRLLIPEGTSHA